MRVYLLHSGGLDSHMAWLLNPWMTPVYVMHGAANESREVAALDDLSAADLRFMPEVIEGPILTARYDSHITYRNLILLTTVAHRFSDAAAIAYGSLLGEGTGDKSASFRRALYRVWNASERPAPQVLAPLRRYTKAGALRRVLEFAASHPVVNPDDLRLTVSCYAADGPCGECQACFRRGVAEYLVGWRTSMPPRPTRTLGPLHAIRSVPPSHLPSMAVSNLDVLHGWWKETHDRHHQQGIPLQRQPPTQGTP